MKYSLYIKLGLILLDFILTRLEEKQHSEVAQEVRNNDLTRDSSAAWVEIHQKAGRRERAVLDEARKRRLLQRTIKLIEGVKK